MTREEAADVFRRINEVNKDLGDRLDGVKDALADKIDGLTVCISTVAAEHQICRPIVMGNGKKSLSDRVTALETRSASRTWIERAIAGAFLSIVIVLVGWLPHVLKWW